jgi:hypothetical protein
MKGGDVIKFDAIWYFLGVSLSLFFVGLALEIRGCCGRFVVKIVILLLRFPF